MSCASNYASIDGSVHWFNEDKTTPGNLTYAWRSRAPGGSLVSLGGDVRWGWWNGQ